MVQSTNKAQKRETKLSILIEKLKLFFLVKKKETKALFREKYKENTMQKKTSDIIFCLIIILPYFEKLCVFQ